MREIQYREALNEAMCEEMHRDDRVFLVLGESGPGPDHARHYVLFFRFVKILRLTHMRIRGHYGPWSRPGWLAV